MVSLLVATTLTMVAGLPTPAAASTKPEARSAFLNRCDLGADRADRSAFTVEVVYCTVLDRRPGASSRWYWHRRLDAGFGVVSMVEALTGSTEYQQRATPSPWEALSLFGTDRDAPNLAVPKTTQPVAAQPTSTSKPPPTQRSTTPKTTTTKTAVVETKPKPKTMATKKTSTQEPGPASNGFRKRQAIVAKSFAAFVDKNGGSNGGAVGPGGNGVVVPGVVYRRIDVPGQQIHVTFVHLSRATMRVSPGDRGPAVVGDFAQGVGGVAALNGNWFSPWDGPAVSGGKAYAADDHGYTALFGMTADQSSVIEHHAEVNGTVDQRIREAVGGHPTLVHRGTVTADFGNDPTFTNRHPRSAIALDSTGDVLILVAVDGRSKHAAGMTGSETAKLLNRLGAHDAVMLDGGGSTTMWLGGKGIVNTPSGQPRAVGNQIAIVPR